MLRRGVRGLGASVVCACNSRALAGTHEYFPATRYRTTVFNSRIWLAGGYNVTSTGSDHLDHLWSTSDGMAWRDEGVVPWLPRSAFVFATALLPDNVVNDTAQRGPNGTTPRLRPHLIAAAGTDYPCASTGNCTCYGDSWVSSNGTGWTQQGPSQSIPVLWSPRSEPAYVGALLEVLLLQRITRSRCAGCGA